MKRFQLDAAVGESLVTCGSGESKSIGKESSQLNGTCVVTRRFSSYNKEEEEVVVKTNIPSTFISPPPPPPPAAAAAVR